VVGAGERICFALVNVFLACFSSPAHGAIALVLAHLIDASSAVFTRIAATLIILSADVAEFVIAFVAHALVISMAVFA